MSNDFKRGLSWAHIRRNYPAHYMNYVQLRLNVWRILRDIRSHERFGKYILLPLATLAFLFLYFAIVHTIQGAL